MNIKGKYSIIEDNVQIGEDTTIWNYTHIREGAQIGKNCNIGDYNYIDKGVLIGDNVKIQNRCDIYHGVVIEDDVFIGPNVTFTNVLKPKATHEVPVSSYVRTIVRKGASIGANCTIICGAEIGEGTLVAAGCTVLGNQKLPSNRIVHGHPVKHFPKDVAEHQKQDYFVGRVVSYNAEVVYKWRK